MSAAAGVVTAIIIADAVGYYAPEMEANVAFDEMLKQPWHRQVLSRLVAPITLVLVLPSTRLEIVVVH